MDHPTPGPREEGEREAHVGGQDDTEFTLHLASDTPFFLPLLRAGSSHHQQEVRWRGGVVVLLVVRDAAITPNSRYDASAPHPRRVVALPRRDGPRASSP